ncbi:MAG: ATP cone domain-containing protein [Candidatus Harrisonbacteria bacterium]|nr:ATP cone domain-containing protein [Candidatus Harrisonbacteria bacterium]
MTRRISLSKDDLGKIKKIYRRSGEITPFNISKIQKAVLGAFNETREGTELQADQIASFVYKDLARLQKANKGDEFIPSVEMVQDLVEEQLIYNDFAKTARAYILYRERHAQLRRKTGSVPEHVRKLVEESKKYFRNPLAEFVYYRTYAKWIDEEGRRETWIETVSRYVGFMKENLGKKLKEEEYEEIKKAILRQEAMPSMRLMQFAGTPAKRCNVVAYNCSFTAPKTFQDIAEIMYISMSGTGVGFAVESQNVQAFPQIELQTGEKLPTYVIPDSKEGWADAFSFGMKTWFSGKDVEFDFSQLRPAGARLKTMGGKASGPKPLMELLQFTRGRVLKRQGKRLSNIDLHDIICKVGECVVAGGVRRSALISLSDLDDEKMKDAKKGQFWLTEGQRSLANNSAVYSEKPSNLEFMEEWLALMQSGTGERGIFNRGSLKDTLPKRRLERVKGERPQWGTNPCGEIILKPKQFCNLSEIIARSEDTEASLMKKVRIATILGTYQSTLTKLSYLSKEWKNNCEQERLLGVSITGQWDSKAARDPKILEKLKKESIRVNRIYAKRFGIPTSTAITCVKPSGTVSQVVDAASGMHPRHSQYYIRRIRISSTDALFKMLKDQKVPYYPEVGQTYDTATTFVFEFPVQAPKGAIFKDEVDSKTQLEHWKVVKENFTEHNPSVTVSVSENEWLDTAHWVYENWNIIGGLSFLPRNDHLYQLAPYESITKERYEDMKKGFEGIDFSKIVIYEKADETDVKKEMACVAGVCEIDDVLAEEANKSKVRAK